MLGQLFAVKHPKTWIRFERGEIEEGEMYKDFFTDGRVFDGPAMKEQMVGGPGPCLPRSRRPAAGQSEPCNPVFRWVLTPSWRAWRAC